ncbi:class I SAM-dependent methyltransferase [Chloroflexota bacterium]
MELKNIWGNEWAHDIDFVSKVIRHLKLGKDCKILDVGTGQGIMAVNLALNGHSVLTGEPEEGHEAHNHYEQEKGAFEYHHEHQEVSFIDWKEAAKAAGVEEKIRFKHFNAENLPFPSESFDAVFLYDALQHIQDRANALSECIRVTRHEGVLCIIEANDDGIKYYKEIEGFDIDKVDPREICLNEGVSTEVFEGEYSNAYILRPASHYR